MDTLHYVLIGIIVFLWLVVSTIHYVFNTIDKHTTVLNFVISIFVWPVDFVLFLKDIFNDNLKIK